METRLRAARGRVACLENLLIILVGLAFLGLGGWIGVDVSFQHAGFATLSGKLALFGFGLSALAVIWGSARSVRCLLARLASRRGRQAAVIRRDIPQRHGGDRREFR